MGTVRKLATLGSLAVYFNTDSKSITESSQLLKAFHDSVCHQFGWSYVTIAYFVLLSDITRREGITESPVHIKTRHKRGQSKAEFAYNTLYLCAADI